MRSRARLGLVIGSIGAMVAFLLAQADRLLVQPQGPDATAQAEAQSVRLNVVGAILIVAATLAVVSGLVLMVQRRSRSGSR